MITSVKLHNFLSHKDTELSFDNGVTVFIGENGAGKSSIIEAITFALFGKTRRGAIEDVIRDGETQAVTQIYFEVNGKKYQAIKKIHGSTSPQELLDDNSLPIAKGKEKVSEEIKKIIGLDYDTLGIASIVPQGQLTEIIQSDNGIKLRSLIDNITTQTRMLRMSKWKSIMLKKLSLIQNRKKKNLRKWQNHLKKK